MKTQQLVNYTNQTAINLPHNKYIDKVVRSNSFEELWNRFKDAESPTKEISESYAAFSNMKKVCQVSDYTWVHIGDGAYTRTAAIFAFFSKTLNYTIDPNINMDKYYMWEEKYNVSNIEANKCKFENFHSDMVVCTSYNICCVHAHVNLEEVDKKFPDWCYLYSNPCCFSAKQTFSKAYMKDNGIQEIVNRLDLGIQSHQRKVVIYKKN